MEPTHVGCANPVNTVSDVPLDHYKEMASSGTAITGVEETSINPARSTSPFCNRADDDQCIDRLSKLAGVIKVPGFI